MAEADLAQTLAANMKPVSVVAPAGYGKTEELARIAGLAQGRSLVLTHTHAGVDVLRDRLKTHDVPREKWRVETIAGWCLRYATAFPMRSQIAATQPKKSAEWNDVYDAARRLVTNEGAIGRVLRESYSRVLVDEYQDCSLSQHSVICGLANHLPVCVFGDPLQSIFDFGPKQKAVDWEGDVRPVFECAAEMDTPWRWRNAENEPLAAWLATLRRRLQAGSEIDLRDRPACVRWAALPQADGEANQTKINTCRQALKEVGAGSIIVITDSVNRAARVNLSRSLAIYGFSNVEPVACSALYAAARDFETKTGSDLLAAVTKFLADCMTGCERAAFLKAVESRRSGKKAGGKKFGNLIERGMDVIEVGGAGAILRTLDGFRALHGTRVYTSMLGVMCSALRTKMNRPTGDLGDAVWAIENRLRHGGRIVSRRSVGSTLLVKGLEFDHSVVIQAKNMSKRDWYVALSRATKGVTILSHKEKFTVSA